MCHNWQSGQLSLCCLGYCSYREIGRVREAQNEAAVIVFLSLLPVTDVQEYCMKLIVAQLTEAFQVYL